MLSTVTLGVHGSILENSLMGKKLMLLDERRAQLVRRSSLGRQAQIPCCTFQQYFGDLSAASHSSHSFVGTHYGTETATEALWYPLQLKKNIPDLQSILSNMEMDCNPQKVYTQKINLKSATFL